jgi:hypothetical protein
MNAIERKKQEHHAKIRALASQLRVLGLDKDTGDPETDALAEEIYNANTEGDLKDALGFAAYIAEMADSGCADCRGLGAVALTRCKCKGDVTGGVFVHKDCADGVVSTVYDPCDCARRNERKRREAQPVARVTGTGAKANLQILSRSMTPVSGGTSPVKYSSPAPIEISLLDGRV